MTDHEISTRAIDLERMAINDVRAGHSHSPKNPLCDAVLYIGLRYLYIAYTSSMATKEEIAKEKRTLLTAYRDAVYDQELYTQMAKRRNTVASELIDLNKCECEYCKRLIRIFDGRCRDATNMKPKRTEIAVEEKA